MERGVLRRIFIPIFNNFKKDQLTGGISLSADAAAGLIKVILLSGAYAPDIDAHTRYQHVSAFEVNLFAAVGYSAGGQAISAGLVYTQDNTNDRASFAASNITWSSSTITARYAVIVKVRASGANKENDNLVGYIDFTSNQSSSNGNFTIQWDASGVLLLS